MKDLKDYIIEEVAASQAASPSNTLGMGNPMPADVDHPGTEPIIVDNEVKRRKKKCKKCDK